MNIACKNEKRQRLSLQGWSDQFELCRSSDLRDRRRPARGEREARKLTEFYWRMPARLSARLRAGTPAVPANHLLVLETKAASKLPRSLPWMSSVGRVLIRLRYRPSETSSRARPLDWGRSHS
jgi:hypothetical protein